MKEQEVIASCLEIIAWTLDKRGEMEEILGVRHKTLAREGVEFQSCPILVSMAMSY
jgi:anthranilate synthase component II